MNPGTRIAAFIHMAQSEYAQHDSIGELFRGILADLRTLIREELALARFEMHEQAGRVKTAAAIFGFAVAALAFGGMFLLVAAALGVAYALNWPAWAGFLVLALLLAVAGGVALPSARK